MWILSRLPPVRSTSLIDRASRTLIMARLVDRRAFFSVQMEISYKEAHGSQREMDETGVPQVLVRNSDCGPHSWSTVFMGGRSLERAVGRVPSNLTFQKSSRRFCCSLGFESCQVVVLVPESVWPRGLDISCVYFWSHFGDSNAQLHCCRNLLLKMQPTSASVGITGELVRNLESQAPPEISWIIVCIMTRLPVTHKHIMSWWNTAL